MQKTFFGAAILATVLAASSVANSASVTIDWPGTIGVGSMSLDVDDDGGNTTCNDFGFDGTSHTSSSAFIISDGNGVDLGGCDNETPGFMGNGVTLLAGPFADLPNVDQIVAQTDTPFTPITLTGTNTQLGLFQTVYVNNDKDYAIYELRAQNNAASASPVFIGMINDWDISSSGSTDGGSDFDPTRGLIVQLDEDSDPHYSVGMASLINPVDQFLLGTCCGLNYFIDDSNFADPYVLQKHFLNNSKPTEECDDGGDAPADGGSDTCSPKCLTAVAGQVCGNGSIEGDEECDDGNLTNSDGCDDRCLEENGPCGNGTLDAGEECDDANRTSGDGCSLDCTAEFSYHDSDYCGDGFVNNGATGFQADIANEPDLESSLSVKFSSIPSGESAVAAFCILGAQGADQADSEANLKAKADDCLDFYQQNIAVCGNSIQNAGEGCDDGNLVDNDGCDSNCTLTGCGNGILNPGEACDDGNLQAGDGCSAECQIESTCGNGIVDEGEACDDGNDNNEDTCTNACTFGPGFQFQGSGCSLAPSGLDSSTVWNLLGLLSLGGFAIRRRLR